MYNERHKKGGHWVINKEVIRRWLLILDEYFGGLGHQKGYLGGSK